MTPTPFEDRLMELHLLDRPEDAEERAFLEDWVRWKAAGGPAKFEAARAAAWRTIGRNEDRLRRIPKR